MSVPQSTENALEVVRPTPLPTQIRGPRLGLPTRDELAALMEYGQVIVESGLAPKHITKPEAALVVMRYGHQLGIDEFTALQNMFVVGGKPSAMASLLHSLILRDHGGDAIQVLESSAERCVLRCRRRDSGHATEVSYTIEEAKAAGLVTNGSTWNKYPADLLFARAISRAGRQLFRDSTMGMYTPEEIGGSYVEVRGEIVDVGAGEGPLDEQPHATNRLANLHRIGSQRGLAHDDLHRIALFKVGKSLGLFSASELRDFEAVVERAADGDIAVWATDWGAAILLAEGEGTDALVALGERMKAAGITSKAHRELAIAYKAAVDRLKAAVGKPAEPAPDEPIEAAYSEVPGMPTDVSHLTK